MAGGEQDQAVDVAAVGGGGQRGAGAEAVAAEDDTGASGLAQGGRLVGNLIERRLK